MGKLLGRIVSRVNSMKVSERNNTKMEIIFDKGRRC